MCGIVGTCGSGNQVLRLITAPGTFEYRGYDACGVTLFEGGRFRGERTLKREADLEYRVNGLGLAGGTCIAHRHWATLGAVARLRAAYADPLSPIMHVIPLQLHAYHVGYSRSAHGDEPRNLAKSVTVK
jgi:glucosamine 6-phosphate synthetase-like amidotransferase/phosphosugar isomerase protein